MGMKRREFIEKALLIGGLATLQPWQLLHMVGGRSLEDARRIIEQWDIGAEALPLTANYRSQAPSLWLDSSTAALTVNAKGSGDATVTSTDFTTPGFIRPSTATNALRLNISIAGTINTFWTHEWTINQSLDSIGRFHFAYYNPNGWNYTVGGFNCTLGIATDNTHTTEYRYKPVSVLPNLSRPGWNLVTMDRATPSAIAGSPTFSTIMTKARLFWQLPIGVTGDLYLSPIYINGYNRPKVVFSFDDNVPSQYDVAFTYMNAAGRRVPGSLAVIPRADGVGITLAQLTEMKNAGWSFHSHTNTHIDLPSSSEAVIRAEMTASQDWLDGRGLTYGRTTMIAPYNNLNSYTEPILTNLGYTHQVGWGSQNNNALVKMWDGLDHPKDVQRVGTDGGATLAALTAQIDAAVRDGAAVIFTVHSIKVGAAGAGGTETETALFQSLVDYAVRLRDSNVLDIVSLQELIDGLGAGRRPRY